jgi:hypothetical protein
MKWIWEVIKWILGYAYMTWKFFAFLIIGTIYFLWEFRIGAYKRTWEYLFDSFYKSESGMQVWWRYETIEDWVSGNKKY